MSGLTPKPRTGKRVSIAVEGGGRTYAEENLEEIAGELGEALSAEELDQLAQELGLHVESVQGEEEVVSDDEEEGDEAPPKSAPAPSQGAGQSEGAGVSAAYEGWLKKEGGKRKTVKRRWFVLDPNANTLLYFVQQGSECLGMVPLMDVGVLSMGKKKHGFAFELFPMLGGTIKSSKKAAGGMKMGAHDSFVLFADTEEERDAWVRALNSSSTNRDKEVADMQVKLEERQVKFDDFSAMLTAYSVYDRFEHGVVPRSELTRQLEAYGAAANVAKALSKILDHDGTQLIALESFMQAWRLGCLPVKDGDGWRANVAVHDIITPMIAMGTQKGDKGNPFTPVTAFTAYLDDTYSMRSAVTSRIALALAKKSKITSIAYVRGVFQGVVPTSRSLADEVSEMVREFHSCDPQQQHFIPRTDFHRVINDNANGRMAKNITDLLFCVVTLRSGGKLTLVEFVQGVRHGIIPIGRFGTADAVTKRLTEIQDTFNQFSGGEAIPADLLKQSLRAQGYSRANARVVVANADVDANSVVDLVEFVRMVVWGLVDKMPVSPKAAGGDEPGSARGLSRQPSQHGKSNQLKLSQQVIDSALKFIVGEINTIQMKISADREVVQVRALWCDAAQLQTTCVGEGLSYIVFSGNFKQGHESSAPTLFMTVLPPDHPHKEKMLYMIMKRAIVNRLQAAGLDISVQVDVKNPTPGLGEPSLRKYSQQVPMHSSIEE